MKNTRRIGLNEGTGMGDILYIFDTNAPKEELKELEKVSCEAYISGNGEEDVPIWADVLSDKGYIFNWVADHQHISPYGDSKSWKENNYPEVTEIYTIENQPELAGV